VPRFKVGIVILFISCAIATVIAGRALGGIQPERIRSWLLLADSWAPIAYIFLYVMATVLVFPSTPLNLMGGAFFGLWLGLLWTSIAAIVAAIASFVFARTVGREAVVKRLGGRWQTVDAGVQQGGAFYIFVIRLVPMIPYGLLNFAAGLTSVRFQDYVVGTVLGTVPSIFPYVLLGSYGVKALQTGELLPLTLVLALVGLLLAASTWYRRHRVLPKHPKKSLFALIFKRNRSRDS